MKLFLSPLSNFFQTHTIQGTSILLPFYEPQISHFKRNIYSDLPYEGVTVTRCKLITVMIVQKLV